MKGAYLVSQTESFEDDVWTAAKDLGAELRPKVAQFQGRGGQLLTIFGGLDLKNAWDWREGPFNYRGSGPAPDLSASVAVSIECRSEEMFATVVRELAALLPSPAWVIDGDGVVWPADRVDPNQVRL